MGLFMLCACHNAIFTVLPCKHKTSSNKFNSVRETQRLHALYLHFKDK